MSAESERITDERSSTEELPDAPDEIRQPETSGASMPTAGAVRDDDAPREPLLSESSANGYRGRWEQIQARFVDDPRTSVEEADALVNEVIHDLETSFGSERETLEGQWQRGEDIETENLRVVLRRYRSFFDRLLSA